MHYLRISVILRYVFHLFAALQDNQVVSLKFIFCPLHSVESFWKEATAFALNIRILSGSFTLHSLPEVRDPFSRISFKTFGNVTFPSSLEVIAREQKRNDFFSPFPVLAFFSGCLK